MTFTVPSPKGGNLICLSRADAAEQLRISSRTLYERTAPRGPICSVRFGRRVLYPISEIDRYIVDQPSSMRQRKAKRTIAGASFGRHATVHETMRLGRLFHVKVFDLDRGERLSR